MEYTVHVQEHEHEQDRNHKWKKEQVECDTLKCSQMLNTEQY